MRTTISIGLSLLAMTIGCSEARQRARDSRPGTKNAVAQTAGPCARQRASVMEPIDGRAPSSTIAVVRAGEHKAVLVADEDDRAIRALDAATMRELAVTPLGGAPAHVLPLADGRIAVALRDKNEIAILEPRGDLTEPLETRCTAPVATEPFGMAAVGEHEVAITSAWGARLTVMSTRDLDVRLSRELAREPRAVMISADGKTAFVTHAVGGVMSAVELDGGATSLIDLRVGRRTGVNAPRESGQGFALTRVDLPNGASRMLAPLVSVDPGAIDAPVTSGYGGSNEPSSTGTVASMVAVVDSGSRRMLLRGSPFSQRKSAVDCLLPRAAVVRGHTMWLACLGIDAVLELDARFADPIVAERRRHPVASGPTGVAVDSDAIYVWSQFGHAVTRIDSNAGKPAVATLARGTALSAKIARGRELYHATTDARISRDGRACASCHPDGRDDGLAWTSPNGLRQTKVLAADLGQSAPYGWFGEHKSLPEHMSETVERLGGTGFKHERQRPDIEALAEFVAHMPVPRPSAIGMDATQVARGKELFHAEAQGCAGCHHGGGSNGVAYDIGSATKGDKRRPFDTPSLRLIGGSAPYFHDGRYATLRELLIGADGTMGHTGALSEADMRALETYLRTL
jgi:mono/diheme cytochrome c family protein